MMEDVISVIVCTYNQEKTISRTLDSILMQKCTLPLEIVIGEDCSTDGTREICQRYQQLYPDVIRLVANESNKGLVDNYFDCMLSCRGKYIADCAGDDYWIDSYKLEKQLKVMDANPDVGIVHTNWQFVEADTEVESPSSVSLHQPGIEEGSDYLEDILTQTSRPAIHLCTSMYRADWICKAHEEFRYFFRNKAYPCEDVQVAFFLSRMGKVAYLPDITLNYCCGGETISNSAQDKRLFLFYFRATQLCVDLADTFNLRTPRFQSFMNQRVFKLVMHAFRAKDKELLRQVVGSLSRWNVSLSLKCKVVLLVMSNFMTWSIALSLRKVYVDLKG